MVLVFPYRALIGRKSTVRKDEKVKEKMKKTLLATPQRL